MKGKKLRIQCQRVSSLLKSYKDAIYLFLPSCGCGLRTSCWVETDISWVGFGNKEKYWIREKCERKVEMRRKQVKLTKAASLLMTKILFDRVFFLVMVRNGLKRWIFSVQYMAFHSSMKVSNWLQCLCDSPPLRKVHKDCEIVVLYSRTFHNV